jgi:hypothetical protein
MLSHDYVHEGAAVLMVAMVMVLLIKAGGEGS